MVPEFTVIIVFNDITTRSCGPVQQGMTLGDGHNHPARKLVGGRNVYSSCTAITQLFYIKPVLLQRNWDDLIAVSCKSSRQQMIARIFNAEPPVTARQYVAQQRAEQMLVTADYDLLRQAVQPAELPQMGGNAGAQGRLP